MSAPPSSTQASERRLAANRANAQLSTGPKTPEGKAKSSRNAVRTGLTGRTVLLPTDDAAEYEKLLRELAAEYQPVGRHENELVQALADHTWRLMRIPGLEMAIYAAGHEQFAEKFAAHDPAMRNSLIQMHTFLHYEKQLRNLQLQEGRLRRYRQKDLSELEQLQMRRRAKETRLARPESPARSTSPAVPKRENGFEFSLDDLDPDLNGIRDLIKARRAALEENEAPSERAKAA